MALVLTLSTVVLLTTLVLAFFSRAQLNRQISFSSTNLFKADALSRSALDIIVGELRAEIADPLRSVNTGSAGVTLSQPIKPEFCLPSQLGVSGATGPLLKVSASGVPLRVGGTITGSSISINATSVNGRSISSSRWFTSSNSSPKLGSQGTMPTWLFMTRASGVKTPTIANAKDTTHNDYVIGRFAYTVYDTGGLFDATVAGYPTSTPFAKPSTDIAFKPSTTYADLSLFGFATTNIDSFISWRNAATSTDAAAYLEWAAGIKRTTGISNYAALTVAQSGHRSIVLGDNTPLTRRELLFNRYLIANPGITTCTLSHFSRSLNAPAFSPPTASISATNPNLGTLRVTNTFPSITHYRDDGTTETTSVVAGDIQLRRRFSLAKLAWLGPTGPNAAAFNATLTSSQREQAIKDCFGLEWNSNRWRYTAASATAIKNLTEVANENREPNFFELLKAGILNGSLGRASDNKTLADNTYKTQTEANKDLQILRIGACILDNADSDNYPTTIVLPVSGTDVVVHGVEDLPYLYAASAARLNDSTALPTNVTVTSMSCVLVPMLFNPHQASGVVAPNIRIRIANGTLTKIAPSGPASGSFYTALFRDLSADPLKNLASRPAINVPGTSLENFRTSLKTVDATENNSDTNTQLTTLVPGYTNAKKPHAFLLYKYSGTITYDYPNSEPDRSLAAYLSNFIMALEYLGPSGNWVIYDTLTGNEAYNDGIGTNVALGLCATYKATQANHNNQAIGFGATKFDPRTTRFGLSSNGNLNINGVKTPLTSAVNTANPNSFNSSLPFSPTPASVFPGEWAEGGKTSWSATVGNNVSDPDNVTRPADAWLDANSANLYRDLTDMKRRPVILQRAYRSVAELGLVFRDNPGKTLSFFDDTSGDKALLDLFSVYDEPTVGAGRVNLNTTQTKIHQALFTGTAQAPDGTSPLSNPSALATAYNSFAYSSGIPTITMSATIGNAVDFMKTTSLPVGGATGLDAIKYRREAVMRSLSNTTQTRTWNLLIDVVSQAGHYGPNAGSLDNFIVEGERRYWLHVAIDRITGKVIDQQLEPAND